MNEVRPVAEELRTGWEPDTPPDDSVARAFVLAYADRLAEMARYAGGRSEDLDGARLVDLGSPFGYDNAVVVTRPWRDEAWPSVVDAARAFFPPERWWVLLSPFATPTLSGLERVGHPPLMLRPPPAPTASVPGLEVRAVVDENTLDDFTRVLVAGYGLVDVGAPAIADLELVGSVVHLRVGYVGGVPVAVAGGSVHHGIIEVDWVATLPEARRQGFGAAVTTAVLQTAPDLPAVLISSDDGHGVYRGLGFLDLFRMTMWQHVPTAAAPDVRR